MAEALALARRGEGRTAPNPPVGAVVVKDGQIIGHGFHPRAGEAHAEVLALREAGAEAQGATLYVTLEPCPTQGRTPPCTDAILASGIAQVVVATIDPNPRVSGRGIERLREAGVRVRLGDGHDEATHLVRFYARHVTQGRPYVIYKYAMSLDGRVTAEPGGPTAISGSESQREVHALRDRVDCVLIGIGTALADDPRLTVRHLPSGEVPDRQPLRVIADTSLRLPSDARVIRADPSTPPVVACLAPAPAAAARRLREAGAEVLPLDAPQQGSAMHGLPLRALLTRLGERGIMSVLVEGGPTLATSLLADGLVDEIVAIVSPHLVGGSPLATPLGTFAPEALAGLRTGRVRTVGTDIWVEAFYRQTDWETRGDRQTETDDEVAETDGAALTAGPDPLAPARAGFLAAADGSSAPKPAIPVLPGGA